MRKRIPRTRIPIVFLENTTIAQFLRLYPYLKGRKNELEQLKSQQKKKHSPNTGEEGGLKHNPFCDKSPNAKHELTGKDYIKTLVQTQFVTGGVLTSICRYCGRPEDELNKPL